MNGSDRDLTVKLQREQASHKITKDEAQKARNALAFVRTQAQHDAKKRDAQLERTMQQWQRLCNDNARVSTASSRGGMLLLNPVDPVLQIPRAVSTSSSCELHSPMLTIKTGITLIVSSGLVLGSRNQRVEPDHYQPAGRMRGVQACDAVRG